MKYTVDITDAALQDMDEIYDYIYFTFRAPDTAAAQYDRIADEILSLEEMPPRFGIPQFEPCISAQLHRMLVDNFSVFYLIRGETVIVTDVLYSASDLEARLGARH
ncbi:MAG TPA: addiction module toxin RelE [Clostridiales bacterium]|nr:addiction module toxin RelE [Clostridiales bacterium]